MFQQQLEALAGMYTLAERQLDDPIQLIVRLDFFDSVRHQRGIADRSKIRPGSQNVPVGEIKSTGFGSCLFHRLLITLPLPPWLWIRRFAVTARPSYCVA